MVIQPELHNDDDKITLGVVGVIQYEAITKCGMHGSLTKTKDRCGIVYW